MKNALCSMTIPHQTYSGWLDTSKCIALNWLFLTYGMRLHLWRCWLWLICSCMCGDRFITSRFAAVLDYVDRELKPKEWLIWFGTIRNSMKYLVLYLLILFIISSVLVLNWRSKYASSWPTLPLYARTPVLWKGDNNGNRMEEEIRGGRLTWRRW